MEPKETLGIVGAGRVGQALARLLAPHFRTLLAARSRPARAAEFAGAGTRASALEHLASASDCVVIAVPDRGVSEVAERLSGFRPPVVLQTCGALGPADLRPLPELGCSCATFHPLQTFPSAAAGVAALPGSFLGVCGAGAAAEWCDRLARLLGCTPVRIAEDRLPLYHAAAVMASNCAVGLFEAASDLMERAGPGGPVAARALRPLMEASLSNAFTLGAGEALTGPVARGDAETVLRHVIAMKDLPSPLRGVYGAFGIYMVSLAAGQGLPEADARALLLALKGEG